jgi:chemotaxis protein methyltransferase CheR
VAGPLSRIFGGSELGDREFDRFRRIVHETAGISLADGKRDLLRARLGKVMRRKGIHDFGEYLRIVEDDPSGRELTLLLDAVSTNVTSFFREADHFLFLEGAVLPSVRSRADGPGGRRVRAWSAGCSSGEEPYSIAITLREFFPESQGWDVRILATDLSTKVLSMARNGLYGAERVKTVPPHLLAKSFLPERTEGEGVYYRVRPDLRRMVTFGRLNLQGEYPFRGPFDFVFCRNVMIYFDRATQETLVNRIHRYIAPGGYLFIGHSESLNSVKHPFRYVRPSVYRKEEPSPAGARP